MTLFLCLFPFHIHKLFSDRPICIIRTNSLHKKLLTKHIHEQHDGCQWLNRNCLLFRSIFEFTHFVLLIIVVRVGFQDFYCSPPIFCRCGVYRSLTYGLKFLCGIFSFFCVKNFTFSLGINVYLYAHKIIVKHLSNNNFLFNI